MSTTKQEIITMAKRRLTGAIRHDIQIHLRRNSGLPVKEEEALRALRSYIAVCWYEWATGITARIDRLPEVCYIRAEYSDSMRFHDFYAGSGAYQDAVNFVGSRDMDIKIFSGLAAESYHPRHMTVAQIKQVKRLGKAWDYAQESLKAFTNDLDSILSSNTTVEGLIDDLPQCAEFAKQFLNPKRDQQTSLVVPGAHKRIRAALRAAAKT